MRLPHSVVQLVELYLVSMLADEAMSGSSTFSGCSGVLEVAVVDSSDSVSGTV